nr:MAG TPA: hypothetical protein [Caudoviricetes sp.]DAZ43872.1 MAG TPA: hypothetical protein [Caudoviricetes sp.]
MPFFILSSVRYTVEFADMATLCIWLLLLVFRELGCV